MTEMEQDVLLVLGFGILAWLIFAPNSPLASLWQPMSAAQSQATRNVAVQQNAADAVNLGHVDPRKVDSTADYSTFIGVGPTVAGQPATAAQLATGRKLAANQLQRQMWGYGLNQ
jgi:hypothetical protein